MDNINKYNVEDFADINVVSGQVVKATDKLLVIDADTIVYNACLAAEYTVELLPDSFYTREELLEIEEKYHEEDGVYYASDIMVCKSYVTNKLKKILELTGASKFQLHLSMGRDNFRYKLYPEYKANRIGKRVPLHLAEMKVWLYETMGAYIHTEVEADDAVVAIKRYLKDDCIICAVDKDVLNAVEGTHFNYYESSVHNIDMCWVATEFETARLFPYRQALVGDSSDNIKGVPNIGVKKAKNLIPDCTANPLEILVATYVQAGLKKEDAITAYRLCYMGDLDYVNPAEFTNVMR